MSPTSVVAAFVILLTQITSITLPKDAIRATDASGAVGSTAVVCGNLVGVRPPSPGVKNDPTRVDLDRPFPHQPFSLAIAGSTLKDYKEFFARLLAQPFVCVNGRVERIQSTGAIELKVSKPDQVVALGPIAKNPRFPLDVPRCGSFGMSHPTLTSHPNPRYTAEAMKAKVVGEVDVDVVVLANGSVGETQVIKSLDPLLGLDDEAVAAVKQWKFRPAMNGGVPAACVATAVMDFRLH